MEPHWDNQHHHAPGALCRPGYVFAPEDNALYGHPGQGHRGPRKTLTESSPQFSPAFITPKPLCMPAVGFGTCKLRFAVPVFDCEFRRAEKVDTLSPSGLFP